LQIATLPPQKFYFYTRAQGQKIFFRVVGWQWQSTLPHIGSARST